MLTARACLVLAMVSVAVHLVAAKCPFAYHVAELSGLHVDRSASLSSVRHPSGATGAVHPHGGAGSPSAHGAESGGSKQSPARRLSGSTWAGHLPGAGDLSDPLVRLNQQLFPAYNAAGRKLQPETILVVESDHVVTRRRDGTRTVVAYNTMEYHDLKMVSHTLLSIFVILYPHSWEAGGQPLPVDTSATLSSYLDAMREAQGTLTAARFKRPGQLARQHRIMDAAIEFASSVAASRKCTLAQLESYVRGVMDDVTKNVMEAGHAQIHGLLEKVESIRRNMTAKEWQELRVVVPTSHMARSQSLAAQFFARYFGVDIELSERFMTAEGIFNEDKLVELMNNHVTDYALGSVAFDQLFRMHDDLLCHAASTALDEMLPSSAPSASAYRSAATARAIARTGCRNPSRYDEPHGWGHAFPASPVLAVLGLVGAAVVAGVVMHWQARSGAALHQHHVAVPTPLPHKGDVASPPFDNSSAGAGAGAGAGAAAVVAAPDAVLLGGGTLSDSADDPLGAPGGADTATASGGDSAGAGVRQPTHAP